MVSFFVCLIGLIVGYILYSKFIEKVFGLDIERATPAMEHPDGVDYMPMPTWKAFLIQLLNIAGLGPIFGALSGAIWGPSVYLWIVFGTIFAGGVHDFLSGMLSVRNDGASISEIVGMYLGNTMKNVMRVFSVILLVMVGVVFMVGPAGLLARISPTWMNITFWTIVVLIYYFLATLLPIDKIIGKLYPFFGVCLIVMALGIGGATIFNSGTNPMPEITFSNMHPDGKPIWPLMFITVACGAISGFHSTQSPMVARCIKSEKYGRSVFYGAMVAEGVIALIWASAGVSFYNGTQGLLDAGGGCSSTVYDMSMKLLGSVGGILAMIGVIACPITSGDTAFRSARLTISDWFKIDQKVIKNRLMLAVPLLLSGYLISLIDYQVVWRYFSWSNQTLAMMVLWAGAVYLAKYAGFAKPISSIVAAIPATFMSAVSCTYILYADEGLKLSASISYPIGILFAIVCAGLFLFRTLIPSLKAEKES
ncbi:carbon starvation protein A [Clostridium sp. BJN0001]|uniref:carbon starvation CstA family protein n=1 Tax=Clostridium sp. BJN0001 TaxID=2930219 RepID=UPI001FD62108|nr:carbon starvation protein A [Clostridium sp. BJN0001]